MATAIPVVQVTRDGVESAIAVTPGGAFTVPANDGNVVIETVNPTGGAVVVSFTVTVETLGLTPADLEVSVPAGETLWIGPLPPAVFNDTSGAVAGVAGAGLQLRGLRI